MSKYLFEGNFNNKVSTIKVQLLLIHFKDEAEVHFIYSPHLDLTGYGNSIEDAKYSFEIALEDFIDYTLKKKTMGKVLKSLGWSIKGTVKRPKNVVAPSITTVIGKNEYVSEIFDKYPVDTFHKEVGLPAYA
jgi:hypothetical protein